MEPDDRRRSTDYVTIAQAVESAVRLTGVDGAAVAVVGSSRDARELLYCTDDLGRDLDELHFVLGDGPCTGTHIGRARQSAADLEDPDASRRWPVFVPEATGLGARAMFVYPLLGGAEPFGVLELYRRSVGDLTDGEDRVAAACANAIARAVLSHYRPGGEHDLPPLIASGAGEEDDDYGNYDDDVAPTASEADLAVLEGAGPHSRAEVHVASGMVAVQLGITVAMALDRIRAHAYVHGMSVAGVAADIIARRTTMSSDDPF